MKKNKILRLASVMLMLCLITTCAISGTFAKYTTSGKAEDTARVAKWGVVLEVGGTGNAFVAEYKNDAAIGSTAAQNGVSVKATEDVVAPGTSGVLATYKFTGTPEVAFTLAATVDFELGELWVVDSDGDSDTEFYCPLEVTIGSTTLKGKDYTSVTDFEEAVEDAIAGLIFGAGVDDTTDGKYSKDYTVGDTSIIQVASATEIKWAWAFTGNDIGDTALGNLGTPKVTFTLDVSATQID